MNSAYKVSDWMRDPPVVLHPDDGLPAAMERLQKARVSAAPVVDADGSVVGLLSDKDCLRIASHWAMEGVAGGSVAEAMSDPPAGLGPDLDVFGAASCFLGNHFVALPVLRDGVLVGEVQRRDLLRAILQWSREHDRSLMPTASDSMERARGIAEMQRQFATHTREQIASVYRREK